MRSSGIALFALVSAVLASADVHSHHRRHAKRNWLSRRASSSSNSTETSTLNCTASSTLTTPATLANGSWTVEQGCSDYYTVASGDSCWSVLSASNSTLSLEEFRTINYVDEECWNLEVNATYCTGLSSCIFKNATSVVSGCTDYAKASANDTWSSFAYYNNVTLDDLRTLNPVAGNITTGVLYCITATANATSSAFGSATSSKATATWTAGVEKVVSTSSKKTAYHASSSEYDYDYDVTTTSKAWTKSSVDWEPTTTSKYEWTSSSEDEWTTTTSKKTSTTPKWTTTTSKWTPSSSYEDYEPTTTSKTTTAAAKTSSSSSDDGDSSSSSSGSAQMSGDFTYYDVGLGSCGWTNSNSEFVAAASAELYDTVGDSICGKYITLEYEGNSVTVEIVDKCPPCTIGSIDLSPAAFKKLAPLSVGRAPMKWDASPLGSAAVKALGY